jgi:hypothetical protein
VNADGVMAVNRALAGASTPLVAFVHDAAAADAVVAQADALARSDEALAAYDTPTAPEDALAGCLLGDWPAATAVTFRAELGQVIWPLPPALADADRFALACAAAAGETVALPGRGTDERADDPNLRRRLLQQLDLTRAPLAALVAACDSLAAADGSDVTAADATRRDALIDAAVEAVQAGEPAAGVRLLVAARAHDPASRELADTLETLAAGVQATAVAGDAPTAVAATAPAPVPSADAPAAPPMDPPAGDAKRAHLLNVLQHRGHRIFVESGTYLGEAVEFIRPHVDAVITVEIEPKLYAAAAQKFAADPGIEVLQGDALELIPSIVRELPAPALIWLDGHFSGGVTGQGEYVEPAPVILERFATEPPPAGSTIVVDDLRMFGRDPEPWPSLDGLLAAARKAFPSARVYAGLDSLVIQT